jgi:outer membrane protein
LTGCNNNAATNSGTTGKPAPSAESSSTSAPKAVGAATRIAYFNLDSLSLYYDFHVDKQAEFEGKAKKIERRIQGKRQKLAEALQSAQSRAQAGLLSENAMLKEQEKLQKMEQDLQQEQFTASQGLTTENLEFSKELAGRISEFLKEYNADGRYDFIFQYSDAPGAMMFFYKNESLDITNDVIDGLNAAYEKEKGE